MDPSCNTQGPLTRVVDPVVLSDDCDLGETGCFCEDLGVLVETGCF